MPRNNKAVLAKAKRLAENERRAMRESIRWTGDLLAKLVEAKEELDRIAIYTEDNVYDPDRVVNFMHAQGLANELIETLRLNSSE